MKHIIQISGLSKKFKLRGNTNVVTGLFAPRWNYKDAVSNISFNIEPGEAVAFLGPNGAGKTTTTKMLTGLMKSTAGSVKVLGYDPFQRNHEFLRKIGLVMGNKAGLNWDLTANQSFELLQKIYETQQDAHGRRVQELSVMLGVSHTLNTQVRKLSLGERMKLELIGSLLHDPEVLFLDEPTIGLDIESKNNVREFLRKIHKEGKTILLTSHDMDDVSAVCDRVIVINKGKLMFDGSMASLNKQYSDMKFIKLEFTSDMPDKEALEQYGSFISAKKSRVTIAVNQDEVMSTIAKIAKELSIRDITIEAVPLEVIVNDLYKSNA